MSASHVVRGSWSWSITLHCDSPCQSIIQMCIAKLQRRDSGPEIRVPRHRYAVVPLLSFISVSFPARTFVFGT